MTVSDETLMAYLDNELPPEERARVDAMVASDPGVKARLERQARVHAMLSAAFDPMVKETAPERLVSAAMTTPVSLRWRLRERASRLFSGTDGVPSALPRYALMAATVALAVAIGWAIGRFPGVSAVIVPGEDGTLIAQGDLEHALSDQLARDNASTGPLVGVSFLAKDGDLCRTFETGSRTANFAGIACRDAGAWMIKTLAHAEPRKGTGYEVAGAGMPSAVRNAVAEMIDGTPFDAEQERRARANGWRQAP